jgi:hypothetical protein
VPLAEIAEGLRGHPSAGGAQDGLVDLDLVGAQDLGVVGFEARPVRILVVAGNGAIGVEPAGLEDRLAVPMAEYDQPWNGWSAAQRYRALVPTSCPKYVRDISRTLSKSKSPQ